MPSSIRTDTDTDTLREVHPTIVSGYTPTHTTDPQTSDEHNTVSVALKRQREGPDRGIQEEPEENHRGPS